MKRFIYLAVILVPILLAGGCDRQASVIPSGKTVKIGFIGPYTGPEQAKGQQSVRGIRTGMHMYPLLNNGDAVELVVENDHNDLELAQKALKKLVEEDQVSAILIASTSQTVLKLAATADQYKTPILALLATHPDVTTQGDFVSQLCFDDAFQGTVAALFVADELLVDRVAVFTEPDNIYSGYLASEFVNKIRKIGGEVTDLIAVRQDEEKYGFILEELRRKNTELLYLPIGAKEFMRIEEAVYEMGWSPEIMVSDGTLATVLAQYRENVDQLEGAYATDFFSRSGNPQGTTPFGREARRTYRTHFSGIATSYTALGSEGYGILHKAMNRCGKSNDRECINRMVRSTKDFTGIMAKISIGKDGKAVRPLYVNTIRDGKMKPVVKVY